MRCVDNLNQLTYFADKNNCLFMNCLKTSQSSDFGENSMHFKEAAIWIFGKVYTLSGVFPWNCEIFRRNPQDLWENSWCSSIFHQSWCKTTNFYMALKNITERFLKSGDFVYYDLKHSIQNIVVSGISVGYSLQCYSSQIYWIRLVIKNLRKQQFFN